MINNYKKLNILTFKEIISLASRKNIHFLFLSLLLVICSGLMEFFILANLSNIFSIINGDSPNASISISNFCSRNNFEFCITSNESNILYLSLFIIFIIFTFLLRLISSYISSKSGAKITSDIGEKIFANIMRMNYIEHINNNTSELINLCINDISYTSIGIDQLLLLINNITLSTFIILGIIVGGQKIILLFLFGIIFFYFLIIFLIRKRLNRNSYLLTTIRAKTINIIKDSIGNIINVILARSHDNSIDLFYRSNKKLRFIEAQNLFIKLVPRILLETFILLIITSFALFNSYNSENFLSKDILTSIGVIAVGIQRLVQYSQSAFYNWTNLSLGSASAENLLSRLKRQKESKYPTKINTNFNFKFRNLKLSNIAYLHNKDTFNKSIGIKNVSIEIKRGDIIGILGKTGSGKSTLINIMMGLNFPQSGHFYLNDKEINDFYNNQYLINYQKTAAYVPQKIYLMDCSILDNITQFQKKNIDFNLLEEVIRISELEEVISGIPLGINSKIGENGMKLSGGQQQRIGIARALYKKNLQILFLDEATNALDKSTEKKIIKNISNMKKEITIIMIAHRLETMRNCGKLLKIENGQIVKEGKPNDLIS